MIHDATPPALVSPASILHSAPSTQASGVSTPAPGNSATKDEAVISKDGHTALAKHDASPPEPQHPSKVFSNSDAALIGQGIQRSNPAHFKSYDTNGDGKLSAQEARSAGLG